MHGITTKKDEWSTTIYWSDPNDPTKDVKSFVIRRGSFPWEDQIQFFVLQGGTGNKSSMVGLPANVALKGAIEIIRIIDGMAAEAA